MTKEKLIELYINQDKTAQQIAFETGYSKNTIQTYLCKHKIKKGKKDSINKNIEDISKLYLEGKTTLEISTIYGLHETTIQRKLKRAGVHLRNGEIDILNTKFGQLLVLEKIDVESYLCVCDCGREKVCLKKRLLDGRNTSCGCNMNKSGKQNGKWSGYMEISGSHWYNINWSARSRGIDLLITIEEAWNLYVNQNRKCALSNIDIKMPNKLKSGNYNRNHDISNLASLDRIDSSKPYIENNCQWVLQEINYMKMELKQDKFIQLCKHIGEFNE